MRTVYSWRGVTNLLWHLTVIKRWEAPAAPRHRGIQLKKFSDHQQLWTLDFIRIAPIALSIGCTCVCWNRTRSKDPSLKIFIQRSISKDLYYPFCTGIHTNLNLSILRSDILAIHPILIARLITCKNILKPMAVQHEQIQSWFVCQCLFVRHM